MYDPSTMVASFPPYRWAGRLTKAGEGLPFRNRAYQALRNIVGFDIWHEDPERNVHGQRRDDSCRWFDRTPGEYTEAVDYLLKDGTTIFEINRILKRRAWEQSQYQPEPDDRDQRVRGYPMLSSADVLALCLLVARELETRRWWNTGKMPAHRSTLRKMFTKPRDIVSISLDLALNPVDNLNTPDTAESAIHLIGASLNRRFRPWWRHPRWHVHHWRINFMLPRNLRRMFQRCDGCGGRIGWGKSPCISGDKTLCMTRCVGVANVPSPNAKAPK